MRNMCAVALALGAALGRAEAQDDRVEKLIQALESDSKEVRDKAVSDLAKIGNPALEALRKAARSKDAEVKSLAQQAIEKIEWGQGYEDLRKHVKDRFEEGSSPEPLKARALQAWFPNTRFYEVAMAPAAAGGVAEGAFPSVFAIRKGEAAFQRVIVRGMLSPSALVNLIRQERVALKGHDEAFDFAAALLEISGAGLGEGGFVFGGGAATRFEKTNEGWAVKSPNYGTSILIKTDLEGRVVDLQSAAHQFGEDPANLKLAEERARLELEKLKLELEVLKRQLEELNRKK